MFTQCPQCDAIFQLTAEQLKAANGEVRCGQCLSVFNALNHLSENLPLQDDIDNAANVNDEFEQDLDWDEPAANPAPPAETPAEPPIEPTPAVAQDDVFNEVIAEASTHAIPKEEIDRFEEFLETDTQPAEDETATDNTLPTEGPLSAADFLPTQAPAPATSDFAVDEAEQTVAVDDSESLDHATTANEATAADAIHASETSFNQDQPTADEATVQPESADALDALRMATSALAQKSSLLANNPADYSTDDSATDSETTAPQHDEESIHANGDETSNFGDLEPVTADLTAEVDVNDEEFAELDAYLHDEGDTPPPREPTPTTEQAADGEQIIISDSDLEPINSTSYVDTPDAVAEPTSAGGADTTAAPAAEQAPQTGENTQLVHVPSVLLDDLHAAKEEQLRPANTPWVIGTVVLMLTLFLQVAYFTRDELAKDPNLRPWLVKLCKIADCTVSQPYDIEQIEIIGRDVRSHPTARKALIVSTSLINNAEFVQPYPLLLMTFSDINGTLVAQRRFTPREYLSNNADLDAGMSPNLPVRIELELVDPGKNAVNYEFRAEQDPRQTRPFS